MKTDPHAEKAAKKFGVAVEDVTPEQRKVAKLESYVEMYTASCPICVSNKGRKPPAVAKFCNKVSF